MDELRILGFEGQIIRGRELTQNISIANRLLIKRLCEIKFNYKIFKILVFFLETTPSLKNKLITANRAKNHQTTQIRSKYLIYI